MATEHNILSDADAKLIAATFSIPGTALHYFYECGAIQDQLPIEISHWVRYLIDSGPFSFLDKELIIDKLISLGIYAKREGPRGPVWTWDELYVVSEGVEEWLTV